MSVNILELAKGALGGSVLDQLGGLLGEDQAKTQSALEGVLPAILGGMMQTASTPAGAGTLAGMADEADGGLLDDIGGLISNNSGMLLTLGAPLLSMLFGAKQDGLIATIARVAGVGGGSAGTLLKVVAPLVMSMLGKKKKELSLNTDQFASMLMDQKQHVASAMPAEVSQTLNFGEFLGAEAAPQAAAVQQPANDMPAPGGGLLKKLLPLAIVALLGYIGYTQFFAGPSTEQVEATQIGMAGIQKSVGDVTTSLSGITDVESAQEAVGSITAATDALDGIDLDSMGEAGKTQAVGMLGGLITGIESALETAYKIPGVQDVIEPAITPFLDKLRGM